TKTKLYLILDFINGGHLFFHLYRQGIFSEDQARVYTAEIVSAVSHLHQRGIVHRDLKPENILMDADGHVMLTDFGLAKEIDESSRSNSMCGTTEYMAPEILLAKGHNKNADWWSVGILLYEMLTGKPPYTHSNRKKLQEKIINEKVKLLPRLSGEAHSLLKGLLQKDPSLRLGSGARGSDDIKGHKWFKTINWKKLDSRELQPKFKPDISGEECTENFDKCWTAMPLDDSPAPTPTGGEHFHGYTHYLFLKEKLATNVTFYVDVDAKWKSAYSNPMILEGLPTLRSLGFIFGVGYNLCTFSLSHIRLRHDVLLLILASHDTVY
nr:serine/threonine-protein kinase AtPK2/AtPK19-like [Tanacetum cinerariifolium]